MKRKQELHKHAAVRTLFEKLAHSSIMRLNSSSMSKLFDLMLMAFKYQLLKMKYPEELLQITLNHLNSLIEIMTQFNTQPTNELYITVKQEIAYATNTYSKLSSYDYILLKQILFRFFQVKIEPYIGKERESFFIHSRKSAVKFRNDLPPYERVSTSRNNKTRKILVNCL